MKLSKAIEILELNVNQQGMQMPSDCLDAVKLLIEAGKRVKSAHKYGAFAGYDLLPGEDPE